MYDNVGEWLYIAKMNKIFLLIYEGVIYDHYLTGGLANELFHEVEEPFETMFPVNSRAALGMQLD